MALANQWHRSDVNRSAVAFLSALTDRWPMPCLVSMLTQSITVKTELEPSFLIAGFNRLGRHPNTADSISKQFKANRLNGHLILLLAKLIVTPR